MSGGRTVLVPVGGDACTVAALSVAEPLAELLDATSSVLPVAEPDAADVIVAAAGEPHNVAVVLCAQLGAETRAGLSPIARSVLPRISSPLVLVPVSRGAARWKLGVLVIAHDGAPTTTAALRQIAPLARRAKPRIDVVHVVGSGLRCGGERGTVAPPRYVDQPQHEWPSWTHAFLERVATLGDLTSSRLHMLMRVGEPAGELCSVSRHADVDLMVLTCHGHFEAGRAAVLRQLVETSACPMIILRS